MTMAAVLVLTAIFTSCRKDGTDPASSGSDPVSKTEQTGETKPDGNEVSPAPGGDPWSYFDYWTGWDDM